MPFAAKCRRPDRDGPLVSEKPRVQRRSGRVRPLADHLKPVTKRSFGKRGFADGDMIAAWPRVIGEALATLSTPERITYPAGKRSGGTLHLRIASGSIAVELQHMLPLLIERINGYFGYRAVDKVNLIQAPIPTKRVKVQQEPALDDTAKRDLAALLDGVDDPDIRASLETLGTSIMQRKHTKS